MVSRAFGPSTLPCGWGPELPPGWTDGGQLERVLGEAFDLDPVEIIALLRRAGRARFLLVERVSVTASSVVLRAVDRGQERVVAIKLLPGDVVPVEARVIAAVEHPNVVTVHEVGCFAGHTWILMPWFDQSNLLVYAIGRDWRDVLDRGLEVGAALGHCHAAGYVHGDVKPNNVLVKQGRAALADFGLARTPGLGEVDGTAKYMAPERFAGIWYPASDVFAFASTLLDCLDVCDPPPPPEVVSELRAVLQAPGFDERPDMPELLELLELARRAAERPPPLPPSPWISVSQLVMMVALLLVGGTGYAVGGSCASSPARASVLEQDRASIELAIELAVAGDPIGAWRAFRLADEREPSSTEQILALAEALLATARRSPIEERDLVLHVAHLVAMRALMRSHQRGEDELYERARVVKQTAESKCHN